MDAEQTQCLCPGKNIKNLIRQIFSFLFVSGIGWLIDFSVYTFLTQLYSLPVLISNCISSCPAVIWVFWFSSKKIFAAKKSGLKLYQKYLIYFAYQLILVVCISILAQYLYRWLISIGTSDQDILHKYGKILIKLAVTPVTMTVNFIFMKNLIEKL